MENILFLGEIQGDTFQSERHSSISPHKLKLYITHIDIVDKNVLSIEDEKGEKYQVGVCPSSTWKSYYNVKNGNGYRYMAGPYYIQSLKIMGFENSDIPLFED